MKHIKEHDPTNAIFTTITSGSKGKGTIPTRIQEEGSTLATAATTLNFKGSKVTATGSGTTKEITIAVPNVSSLSKKFALLTFVATIPIGFDRASLIFFDIILFLKKNHLVL